ncbi:MAG: HEAT repeat domain-containing protein [Aureispira sp.]|nr:HEAT repeat domain-containing protein [Aureispira sp.]
MSNLTYLKKRVTSNHLHIRQNAIEDFKFFRLEDTLPFLEDLVIDRNQYVRQTALNFMLSQNQKAYLPLFENALDDQESRCKELATKGIEQLNATILDAEVEELCLILLSDQKSASGAAIRKLSRARSTKAIPALTDLVKRPVPKGGFDSRAKAISALGQIGDKSVCPFLLELLKSPPIIEQGNLKGEYYFISIIIALLKLQETSLAERIAPYLYHKSSLIRHAVAQTLFALDWQPSDVHHTILLFIIEDDSEAIVSLGNRAIIPIQNITKNSSFWAYKTLMLALAKIGEPTTLDYILKWLFEPYFIFHKKETIEELASSFSVLFGDEANTILLAASFIDRQKTEDTGTSWSYQYTLQTAIEATIALKNKNSVLSQKALSYVSSKKNVSLESYVVDSEYMSTSNSIDFSFQEQFDVLNT